MALVSVISISIGYCYWRLIEGVSIQIPTDRILKTFCLVGVLEVLYAILQILGIINSHFRYHNFSGSFENPAIFGMLLSFCIPISYYYAIKSIDKERIIWCFITVLMLSFIILSDSRTSLIASISAIFLISCMEIPKCIKLFNNKCFILLLSLTLIIVSFFLYCYKADSANGRILIWNVSYEMIKEKPLWGWGTNGFLAQYMYHQAQFFIQNPNSPYCHLASEVSVPFNEFVKCAVNYGLIALIVMILLLIVTVKFVWTERKPQRSVILSIILSLIIWGMFSYPSEVPFVWLVFFYLVLSVLDILLRQNYSKYTIFIVAIICITMSIVTCNKYYREFERIALQEKGLSDWNECISSEYARIYEYNKDNYKFLYNYGALLHYNGMYKESLEVLKECSEYLADYNVQLLIADNYQQIGIPDSAIFAYRYANAMIPNRFLPLYYEMKVYQEIEEGEKAKETALKIIRKKVKIDNTATKRIKAEAQRCLEF